MGLRTWIDRWRHRHGFGVHSPLAFKMVKEVLWPSGKYAFYKESVIRRSVPPHLAEPLLRAWRLAAIERKELLVVGDLPEEVRRLFPRPSLQQDAKGMVISFSGNPRSSDAHREMTEILPEEGILYHHCGTRPPDTAEIPGELVLVLRDCWIAFSRPGTPRLVYEF